MVQRTGESSEEHLRWWKSQLEAAFEAITLLQRIRSLGVWNKEHARLEAVAHERVKQLTNRHDNQTKQPNVP